MTQKTVTACFLFSTLLLGVLHTVPGSAGCPRNGLLTAVQGVNKTLTSPDYPSKYGNNLRCGWKITAGQGQIIHLYFVDFELEEGSRGCNYDKLVLYDGDGPRRQDRLATLCGSDCNPLYSSTGRDMYIQFNSDGGGARKGFELRFTAVRSSRTTTTRPVNSTGCPSRGLLTAQQDINMTLTSPNYPSLYGHNHSCAWKLTAGLGQTIRLYVVDLELEEYRRCTWDRLILYDADSPRVSKRLATLCGTTYQPVYSSRGRYMYVQFITDGTIRERGFQLLYTAVRRSTAWTTITTTLASTITTTLASTITTPFASTFTTTTSSPGNSTRCLSSVTLSASEGINKTLTSPNYPGPYGKGQQCTWILRAEVGKIVRVYVQDLMLQSNFYCSDDRLMFYNGVWTLSQLAKLCGMHNEPKEISSHGRYMHITFYANYDNTRGRGFKLLYTAETPSMSPTPMTTTPPMSSTPPMWATSPMSLFPTTYPPSSCNGWSASPLRAVFGANNTLTSPNYPGYYNPNQNCDWKITADRAWGNYVVHIFIIDLSLEKQTNCSYDSLTLYDSDSVTGTLLDKLCGNNAGFSYTSTGPHMFVHFHTDGSTSFSGFKLLYEAVRRPYRMTTPTPFYRCGPYDYGRERTLTAAVGRNNTLMSSNYPGSYLNNQNCGWKITADRAWGDYVVHIFIIDLSLERQTNCSYNSLTLYDSDSVTGTLLDKLCGNNAGFSYTSTGPHMFVHFHTDGSTSFSGFQLLYEAVRRPYRMTTPTPFYRCGPYDYGRERTLTAAVGRNNTLMSSNYPGSYLNNQNCGWKITADRAWGDYVVHIFIRDLSLEKQTNCSYDSLTLYDSDSVTGTLLDKLCGNNAGFSYTSTGPHMFVHFHTDGSTSFSGFKLLYEAVRRPYRMTTPTPFYTPGTPISDSVDHSANYALIVAGVVGGFVSLGVFICVVYYVRKQAKPSRPRVDLRSGPSSPPGMSNSTNSGVYMVPAGNPALAPVHGFSNMAYTDGPPAYCSLQFIPAAVGPLPDPNQSVATPPPYAEALMYMHPPDEKGGATGGVAAQPSFEASAPPEYKVASDPAPIALSSQPEESVPLDSAPEAAATSSL
ncbi:hypothetical protein ACOMHN_027005 [Nucella lapillus]